MTPIKTNLIKEMLLIEDPSVFRLYTELTTIAKYFVAPVFTVAIIFEFFGELNFLAVIKKLIFVMVFMTAFYQIHTTAVDTALETASVTLQKVSPNNLFVRKWYEPKIRTTQNKSWGILERLAVPNLNDLLATAFFVISKAFIWLLKLIYSTVYHLTYIFSGVTAVLYFLGWTQDALKGTVQASLWCMILPFVVVAILALVGNSFQFQTVQGAFAVSSIDNLIWLFGVTLLLLITPAITFGMVKGDGIHSFGAKMGNLVMMGGMRAAAIPSMITNYSRQAQYQFHRVKRAGDRVINFAKGGARSQKKSNKTSSQHVASNKMSPNTSNTVKKDGQLKPLYSVTHASNNKIAPVIGQTRNLNGKETFSNSTLEKTGERRSTETRHKQTESNRMKTADQKSTANQSNRVETSKTLNHTNTRTIGTRDNIPMQLKNIRPQIPRRDNELR